MSTEEKLEKISSEEVKTLVRTALRYNWHINYIHEGYIQFEKQVGLWEIKLHAANNPAYKRVQVYYIELNKNNNDILRVDRDREIYIKHGNCCCLSYLVDSPGVLAQYIVFYYANEQEYIEQLTKFFGSTQRELLETLIQTILQTIGSSAARIIHEIYW